MNAKVLDGGITGKVSVSIRERGQDQEIRYVKDFLVKGIPWDSALGWSPPLVPDPSTPCPGETDPYSRRLQYINLEFKGRRTDQDGGVEVTPPT